MTSTISNGPFVTFLVYGPLGRKGWKTSDKQGWAFLEDFVTIFQIMKLFLPFIALTACFDESNVLERERRDLMWFNRHGNTIFNHRHTGGSRPQDQGEFLEYLNLCLICVKLTSWRWLIKYMRKNEQELNNFARTNKNAKSNACWINCHNISGLVNAALEYVPVINLKKSLTEKSWPILGLTFRLLRTSIWLWRNVPHWINFGKWSRNVRLELWSIIHGPQFMVHIFWSVIHEESILQWRMKLTRFRSLVQFAFNVS